MKKIIALVLVVVMTAALSIGGTVAWLTSQAYNENTMTLGNVKIEQWEYERKVNEDGTYVTDTIDSKTSYVLQGYTQDKPLVPSGINTTTWEGWDWDATTVRMTQVGSYGGMQVFKDDANAQDKFVVVKNGDFLRLPKFVHMVNGGTTEHPTNGWHGMYVFSEQYSDGRIYATDLDFKNFKEHAVRAAQYWLTQRQWFDNNWIITE